METITGYWGITYDEPIVRRSHVRVVDGETVDLSKNLGDGQNFTIV